MKRPILIALIGYILGILWGLYLKISIVLFFVLLFLIRFFVLQLMKKYRKIRYFKVILNLEIVCLLCIFATISNLIILYKIDKYDKIFLKLDKINCTATVISAPKEKPYKDVYKIKLESVNGDKKYEGIKLILNIKNSNGKKIEYGDKISFNGTFVYPNGSRNFNGFNYKNYLRSINVYGNVDVEYRNVNVLKKKNVGCISQLAFDLNSYIKRKSIGCLKEKQEALFLGILLGNVDSIEEGVIDDFKDSSLYHMLAVSGSHVAYLTIGVIFLIEKSTMSKRCARFISVFALIFFMFMTNFTPSIVRAVLMGIIGLFASIIYRELDLTNCISLSLFIILIANPFSIQDIGLLLSFSGCLGIIIFYKDIDKLLKRFLLKRNKDGKLKRKIKEKAIDMMTVTLSAQVFIIPITMIYFKSISFTFLFSNILAGLLIGIITIGGFLLMIIFFININIAKFLCIPYGFLLEVLMKIANFSAMIPLSKVNVIPPNMILIILYFLIVFYCYILTRIRKTKNKRRLMKDLANVFEKFEHAIWKRKKAIILVIIVGIIGGTVWKNFKGELKIYFIDVGQGDSTLIITPNDKRILLDAGGYRENELYDVGQNTVVPYLLSRGVVRIDFAIVSHFDADHCNGMIAVLNELNVRNLVISEQAEECMEYKRIIEIAQKKHVEIIVVKAGDCLKLDKLIQLEILYPTEKLKFEDINNNSIVCKLKYNNFSMLFPGDIEEKAEKELTNIYTKKQLKSNILKVAHHGSKSSSSEKFLDYVEPEVVLIGVGANNNFGHPNIFVIQRLEKINSKIYRTDKKGEIMIRVDQKGKLMCDTHIK